MKSRHPDLIVCVNNIFVNDDYSNSVRSVVSLFMFPNGSV
jgi:hypothetical protein